MAGRKKSTHSRGASAERVDYIGAVGAQPREAVWRVLSEPWQGPEATGGDQLGEIQFSTDLELRSGR